MKSWGKFGFLLVAYAFALLHTLVPHQHIAYRPGEEISVRAKCVLPQGVGGFLERVFSTDLGQGHLEDFNKSGGVDLEIPLRSVLEEILTTCACVSPLILTASPTAGYVEKLKKKLILLSSGVFRAPPF